MIVHNPKSVLLLFILLIIVSFSNYTIAQIRDVEQTTKYIDSFNEHSISKKKEKLYVHFDRPAYYCGDKVWFKAYLLLAVNQQKDPLEKILYVELSGCNDSLVIKRNYQINMGLVNGVFYLPDSLATGQYSFVAYTNWMQNSFGGEFFKYDVFIFNEKNVYSTTSEVDSTSMDEGQMVEIVTDTLPKNQLKPEGENITLKFYPEGGTFVDNLTTVVAIEALDSKGKPTFAEGSIKDDLGNFITFFKTFDSGKGFFMIKPNKERTYKAYIAIPDSETTVFNLPEVDPYGYVLNVTNSFLQDSITLRVRAQISNMKEKEHFYLLGIQNGIVKMAIQGDVEGKSVIIKCNKNSFNTGIISFTLLDANMIPQCERLAFVNHYDQLNVKLNVNDTLFKKNRLVEVSVDVSDKKGNPVVGDFSLSVTDAGIISDSLYDKKNIVNYLYFISDFPDLMEYVNRLLVKDEDSHNLTNMVMLTKGWRKFKWRIIEDDYKIQPEYEIEPNNWIKGVVKRNRNKEKLASGISITALLKGEYNDFYSIKTDKNGEFLFSLLDFSDTVSVAIQTTNKSGLKSNYKLDLKSNLSIIESTKSEDILLRITNQSLVVPQEINSIELKNISLPSTHTYHATPNFDDEMKFLEDTSAILLREVEISAERKKTPKEKISAIYGLPKSVVSDKQIESIMKHDSWKSFFEMIQDLFPDLSVVINTLKIDDFTFSARYEDDTTDVFEEDLSLGIVDREALEFSTYRIPPNLVKINLKNSQDRLFYIYVDGEYIASTDERGSMTLMRIPYVISDLIHIDPKNVKSVELILDVKDKQNKHQLDDAFYDYARRRGKPAILAIYTKNGNGVFSDLKNKGMQNMKMLGFVREREFYNPSYSDTLPKPVKVDNRVTLFWDPEVKLDSMGQAKLAFYNSDAAKTIRIELTGMSIDGIPGAKREVFGKSALANNNQPTNRERLDNIAKSGKKLSSLEIWSSYKKEYYDKNIIRCIVLDSLEHTVPFADVLIKNANIETTANMSGIFAFDINVVNTNDTVFINDPGIGHLTTTVSDIINSNGIIKIYPTRINSVKTSVKSLMSDVLRKNKRSHQARNSFEGVYRETIKRDKFIYSLADYSVNMEQYSLFRSDQPHISHVQSGRHYRTTNYRQVIKFNPLSPLNNEVVQLREPLLDDLYFLSSKYKKSMEFKIEGLTQFRGEKVYKVNFRQLEDTNYNLFNGFLLIHASNHNVLYIYRKTSMVAHKFQSGSAYLESTNQYGEVVFIENEYRNSYRIVDDRSVTKFQYSYVKLETDGIPISYTREFHGYGDIEIGAKGRKKIDLDDLNHKKLMVKSVIYNPASWRNGTYLLPDFFMYNQIKNLHEISFYNTHIKQ